MEYCNEVLHHQDKCISSRYSDIRFRKLASCKTSGIGAKRTFLPSRTAANEFICAFFLWERSIS
jgi:hypothetical protein